MRLKYLTTTPEFDRKILVLFDCNQEKSLYYNGQRDPALKVPDDIVVMLSKKYEEPSEEVLQLVDEVVRVDWRDFRKDFNK